MKIQSPAKVNLFLSVHSKRKDGFHEIETLFERISLADTITLLPAKSGIKILTNSRVIPKGPANLAYRAVRVLKDKFQIKKGVVIRIEKRIPVAAGLGGGSSNAAAVLLGLNRLWRLRLSEKKLCELGRILGSDVPFFILRTPFAFGTGRGEILKKIKAPGVKIWHCLVKPDFGISTKNAYKNLDALLLAPSPISPANAGRLLHNRKKQGMGLTPAKANVKILLHSIQKGHSSALTKLLTNSLECTGHSTAPADVSRVRTRGLELTLNKRVTTIMQIKKELLRQGALGCLLSGSGPTVFGIFKSRKKAEAAARGLKKNKHWQVFVAATA